MAIAAVNKTVDWDNLDGFLRYMPNSSVWFSESAGLSKDPDYAFSNFTDASVLFQFSGEELHFHDVNKSLFTNLDRQRVALFGTAMAIRR